MSFNRNTYKNAPKPTAQNTEPNPTREKEQPFAAPKPRTDWLNDRRVRLTMGLAIIFFAVILGFAFISFMFTGKADQSVIGSLSFGEFGAAADEVENWLGLTGALMAHLLVFRWFGLASYLLVPFVFSIGYHVMVQKPMQKVWRIVGLLTFSLLWISSLLGFTVLQTSSYASLSFLCGGFGYELASLFHAIIGWGTVVILVLVLVAFVAFYANPRFLQPQASLSKQEEEEETETQKSSSQTGKKRSRLGRVQKLPFARKRKPKEEPETSQETQENTAESQETPIPLEESTETQQSENEQVVEVEKPKKTRKRKPRKTTAKPVASSNTKKTNKKKQEVKPETAADFEPKQIPDPSEEDAILTSKFAREDEALELENEVETPTENASSSFDTFEKVVDELAEKKSKITPEPKEEEEEKDEVSRFEDNFKYAKENDELNKKLQEDLEEAQRKEAEAQAGKQQTLIAEKPPEPTFYDPVMALPNYKKPELDLLEDHSSGGIRIDHEELDKNKERIQSTLENFKIKVDKVTAEVGPTVTLYEIVPKQGVKISQIRNLEDDIALNLSALGIRIIAPMPGRGTIGIEVPNKDREIVSLKALFESNTFKNTHKALPVVLGKTISNEVFITDLAKMPHLLIGGATGQGKSVGINVLLTSLLYKKHPGELKIVLIDPKKVEFSLYTKLEKHFLTHLPDAPEPVITESHEAIRTLNALCYEMDQRYDLLKKAQCRQIQEYNSKFIQKKLDAKKHRFLPYIVVVIDELADLMITVGKIIEKPIARLAQMARAVGIHLVVATQRPSVNVVTGVIKANFPARMAFRVTSKVDSRVILDMGGAEQLVGQGDMLLSNGSEVIRLQCAFIDTMEVEQVCSFIAEQEGYLYPFKLPEWIDPLEEEEKNAAKNTLF